ncbi:DUF4142 domain-containing protein [Streptomyces ficellus]|uniref:DUF4142 domain-containing protein n=1 Tax=Streptomyces ficellus TaxID=1977088 RepID=A0ABT7ZBP6_9ACTN|nr:DUF4142 domain-containing protein [Streptomyces ficellus]MDN3296924.1 DUF4142 domain-containing protein [Streptomyces ficellus]
MTRTHRWAATAFTCLALTGIAAGPAFAGGTDTATDSAFLRAAHQGNLAEIAAGQDAQKNATTACVKKVGAVLVRDHTKLDADTKALANKLGVDLPVAPTKEQQEKLAEVMAKAGTKAYDAAWLRVQAAAHEKTLARIDNQIAHGKNAQITAAAKAARPVVAMHLDMVRGGECRAGHAPKAIHAGNGGQAALAAEVPVALAVPAVAVGGVIVAAGAFWAAARMRRNDNR